MEIQQIHLNQCSSTQTELAERKIKWEWGETLLVSTSLQTQGKGRRGNTWISTPKALAFSFNLKPQNVVSLTSLELGILICQFFESHYNVELKLKWPNDILNAKNAKVGGILCQGQQKQVLAGIGLNLYSSSELNDLPYPASGVFEERKESDGQIQSQVPHEIVEYVLSHRLSQDETLNRWQNLCAHQNLKVIITDHEHEHSGIFRGIDEYGRAVLENGNMQNISAGSLRF